MSEFQDHIQEVRQFTENFKKAEEADKSLGAEVVDAIKKWVARILLSHFENFQIRERRDSCSDVEGEDCLQHWWLYDLVSATCPEYSKQLCFQFSSKLLSDRFEGLSSDWRRYSEEPSSDFWSDPIQDYA